MKKWIIPFFSLFIAQVCYSQTAEEKEKIKKLTRVKELQEFSRKHNDEYQRMMRQIEPTGKNVTSTSPDEPPKIVMRLDSAGKPVYAKFLDSDGNQAIKSTSLYAGGALGLSVQGEGMTAGMWDDGNVRATHVALENRALNLENATVRNHATFVAGQIIATGAYSPSSVYGKAIGVAFKANVRAYYADNDVSEVANEVANGLLVSNHTYWDVPVSYYSSSAASFDNIGYLAPYYTCVWSAGNAYLNPTTGTDQLVHYANGKNMISVASTAQLTNYTGPSSVVKAFYSSRGPTDDGRIKPDIAANGEDVAGLKAANDNDFYAGGTGTSFSAPQVTGAVLLLQQHYNNVNSTFMRGSTVKGLVLHTASEAGPAPGPDITFGWGLLNVESAAKTISNNGGKSAILEDSLGGGKTFKREFIASGSEPLAASISWTDKAGTVVMDNDPMIQLVNNLDIRLSDGVNTYYPWKLDSTNYNGPALKGDNNRDNIEKIEIANPVAGQKYTLTVSHKGSLYNNGQWFSLIVTGLEECVANRTITSEVNSVSIDQQQASATITLQNNIASGGKAIYHASDEVLLKDGFTSVSGSEVRAYLEGCTNDYNARTASADRVVETFPNIPSPAGNTEELPENAVYPNPGNGVFNVNLSGIPSGKVEVFGADGQMMFGKSFKKQSHMEVDIKTASPGIYILRIVSDQKVLTRKIVKK
ncbi:hypothetical protein J2Y45_002323 [Dyadobacter sp. BE34]|uniref:Peptidase S8 and S53 subtilisin kexin sedolisin n=1 Tax=Dyadobacter fermentans TaxID=94254 RepID=A0ABU1QW28_9BACT|nr:MULTISPECIES: S8 family peptidase [Dyadobacter]MDR6805368.1 hypothetical protein [Dyadobacter fermentans]MDR7042872.1 hypothetical protein [Dyadobacter sp. BE242]MDR7197184.1 hypothetical protein [Dyadobacter sp. BE34]MDR7215381.1 hypothetical protein [Dyadobacter sp. BE31]MDR7262917.1 hypothetical protein [Dyadobacter sp. BE32]